MGWVKKAGGPLLIDGAFVDKMGPSTLNSSVDSLGVGVLTLAALKGLNKVNFSIKRDKRLI